MHDETGLFDRPNQTGTPERRLLLAVLERAILDYVGNDPAELADAQEWFFNELNELPYRKFSFPWICQQLDLDVEKTLATIKRMPKRGNMRVAPWYFSGKPQKVSHA
jgi:hypothetical protein